MTGRLLDRQASHTESLLEDTNMQRLSIALMTGFVLTACGMTPATSETKEIQAENLWVGDATYNVERYVRFDDPCYNDHSLNNAFPTFESWARQRAGYTNVCLEIWKPGVTDQENPNFWRELDVQLHYRWVGQSEWKSEYVDARDRVGNNRRYIWNMRDKDAFSYMRNDDTIPITVIREYPDHGQYFGEAVLEFYFTVNGHGLGNHDATPYRIKYQGYRYR